MKKTKRLAALFLAMMMAFSIMAVTAAAYGEEGHVHTGACSEETIQPRIPAAPYCWKCDQEMVHAGGGKEYYTFKCYRCNTSININK